MGDISLLVISDEDYWNAVGDERYFRENKRTQKLTESNRYDDIRENLNDILYEAQDLGYKTKVDTYSSGDQVIQFDVSIYNEDVEQKLDFYSLNDCLERIIDYVKQTKMFHNPTAHISYYDEEYDELKDKIVGWKNIDSNHSTFDYIKDLIVYGVKLKFRLKYKLYESVDNQIIIYDDIRKIFAELVDGGYNILIKMGSSKLLNIEHKHYVVISAPINSPFESHDYMKFSDIKDELLRLKDYLGPRWIKAGVLYEGDYERVEVNINEEDYDNLDDAGIVNLVVFFNI